jgi:hypothetical protein
MRKLKITQVWIQAFLLAVVVAGCNDPDKIAGTATSPLTPPIVTSVTPPNGSTLVCPNVAIITATFSKPMNPATINTTTFTLSGPSGSVTGTVALDSTGMIATFTPPAASLTPSTTYTATITTGAQDQFGNALAANVVWKFTTSVTCVVLPPPSGLGTACSFGILGATPVVSNTGPSIVTGDVGIWPAASITGFPPGTLTGTGTFHAGDATAMTAQGDLTTAYNNAAGLVAPPPLLKADIGGETLAPGVYSATTTLGITGILTLDGTTNPNGVWVFQVGSALTTAAGGPGTPASQVILIGGASAHNVFWVIGSSATLGTYSLMQGTIMAKASITIGNGATLDGRALAETGAVSMGGTAGNAVNVPSCP